MGLFTSYYDTSRKGGVMLASAMVTAGLVMSETQAKRFCEQWQAELDRAKIPYLHMNELPKHFAGRNADKDIFLDRVVDLLRRRVSKTFAVNLDLDDFDKLDKEFRFRESVLSEFALCAGSCVMLADGWTKKAFPNQPRAHYHESGDDEMGTAQRFAARNKVNLNTLDAVNEQGVWFAPFQAVDFLAWEIRRGHEQAFSPPQHALRRPLERIADTLKIEMHAWNYETMRARCVRAGLPPRTG
jgi:hypothetical protein